MARALALITLALLAGCTTTQDRLSTAATVKAIAQEKPAVPDLPASCVAKMGRVKPKIGEPWVIYDQRWNMVADTRDQASADCQAQWSAYRAALAQ